jgi:hypothetical protein
MSTKVDILDALVAEILAIEEIKTATRYVKTFTEASVNVPSVQVTAGAEEKLVDDATDIYYALQISLLVITDQDSQNIEPLIDAIKDALLGTTCPLSLHANVQVVDLIETAIVELEDEDAEEFASAILNLEIRYHASKAGF